MASASRELVVMVHGIASWRFVFAVMNARLRAAGFATRMWGYPSILWSNQHHGASLARLLRRRAATGKYDKIHLVVHSMGSIVARCALQEELPEQLGRIVMIGPPNQGSHVASRLAPIYGWLAPTLVELCDVEGSFVRTLGSPPEHVEIGVVAAQRDRVVPLLNTHLAGMRDHIVLPGLHTSSLWRRETAEQVVHFLREGRFFLPGERSASAVGGERAGATLPTPSGG
ncbi:Alpha/beta hydrolase family protein [Pirellulimonas nuda]|uniref:Alpha/beta hydrolase family protein n=1 Tax=Pirellulimonas nuda TaxID=2528009 RepID=A0A518D5J2_9BACT|nr:alpha/beta hydrolase [Pirellulimonas nuda]QDU86745.1 Alpha/beta hydrolase family protein [Pirellulimonas nuda]